MTKGFMDNLTALGSSRSRATFCSRQKPNRTVVLGDNSGRILDLSIYDCNMKIGPARRCSSPHRPILGPTSLGDERQLRPCSSDFTYQRWLTWRRRSQQTLCVSLVAHQDVTHFYNRRSLPRQRSSRKFRSKPS